MWAFIQYLPAGSHTHGGGGWSISNELAALQLEVTVAANQKKGSRPFRLPRPETDKPKKSAKQQLLKLAQALKGG